jgi:hypothetical protein
MQIALLRVAVDSGCGRCDGPLFKDGRFEYLPIPDDSWKDQRTYGNVLGRLGKPLSTYFPERRRAEIENTAIHFDPEFESFTYGDPTGPKAGLRWLQKNDILLFYCGLCGFDFPSSPALYLLGYFIVEAAGYSRDFPCSELKRLFSKNWHVIHAGGYDNLLRKSEPLVLVKGNSRSRLFRKAHCISEVGRNRKGQPLKVLSKKMQRIFGDFCGKISIQRSPTRWITDEPWVTKTAKFIKTLD